MVWGVYPKLPGGVYSTPQSRRRRTARIEPGSGITIVKTNRPGGDQIGFRESPQEIGRASARQVHKLDSPSQDLSETDAAQFRMKTGLGSTHLPQKEILWKTFH